MAKIGIWKTVFCMVQVACWAQALTAQVLSTQEYINTYKYAAMQEMKIYNIPASITLGQGILESASGNSKLSRDCNNHFGIKCRKEWTGSFCLIDDDAPNECFRGYSSAMESYRDHSLFLKGSSRYNGLFTLSVTDYDGWANGLRQAGYATNPAYANILIGIIQKYRLSMYDSMVVFGDDYVSPDSAAQKAIQINGLPAVYARAGDSPESIAKAHELGDWQVYKYNDLKRGESLDPGEIVYLKPKRRKGLVAVATVKPGQDMRDVSQEYGIRLKQLYKKNNLKPCQQVKPGEILSLQHKNPGTPLLQEEKEQPVISVKPDTLVQHHSEGKYEADFHEVKGGETLYSIALAHGIPVDDLVRWNHLESTTLKVGQLLLLRPGLKEGLKDTARTSAAEVHKTLKYHLVLKGETVYSIAKLYNQSPDSIVAWNRIINGVIIPGKELVVMKNGHQLEGNGIPVSYTVQPGDTLYGIARKYGVSVDVIRSKNKLEADKIKIGQVLLLQ